jgi:predicted membrane protein
MDFLFLNHSASVEAVIVFLCLTIIFLFLLYDAIIWVKQKYRELHPRKAYAQENIIEEKNDTLEDLHLSAGPLEVLPESA